MEDPLRRPLPAVLHDSYALEHGAILDELPKEIGLVLWQAVRDVDLWAETPAAERGALFSRTICVGCTPPPIASAVAQLLDLSGATSPDAVAAACQEVSKWAEKHAFPATALAFGQSAALICERDANLACRVGYLALQRAEYSRSDSWFRRAIALARRARDWETLAYCELGLGTMYRKRGKLPVAEQHFRRALSLATRHRKRKLAAIAHHDLFALALRRGAIAEAERHARHACNLYRGGGPLLVRLANDVAYSWIARGQFARAVPVLRATIPHVSEPTVHAALLANLARAAGGAGYRELFSQVWSNSMQVIDQPGVQGIAAECLLDLARGAADCEDWERAERAAYLARQRALQHGQAQVVFEVDSFLQNLQSEKRTPTSTQLSFVEAEDDTLDIRLISALS